MERTRFVTDRQTDRQTDGRMVKNNMSPDPVGGRHNKARLQTQNKHMVDICIEVGHGFNTGIAIHSSDDRPRFDSCELF